MAKRTAKKKTSKARKKTDLTKPLRESLAKAPKDELVDVLMELAREDSHFFRQLCEQFKVEWPLDELVAATRIAISDATDFDERDINRNFDYDYAAYDEIERNFTRLIHAGQLPAAMELAVELMKQGSYQVEVSDEGMMSHDIEGCLQVVIAAVEKADLPAAEVTAWRDEMSRADRVGYICNEGLRTLRERGEGPAKKRRR